MRILAIGDPHGDLRKIKRIPLENIDLILLTGDLGRADLARKRFFENIKREKKGLSELEEDSKFAKDIWNEIYHSTVSILRYLSRFAPVYAILGNVSQSMVKNSEWKKEEKKYGIKLPSLKNTMDSLGNFHLPRNRFRKISGLKVGFLEYFIDTSWVSEFKPSDFKEKMRAAKRETEKAKKILRGFGDVDILVCHQPPYGVLDKVAAKFAPKSWQGKHAGSKVILDYIKKEQPKYVFCGHIHESEGFAKIGKTEVYNLGVAGHKIISL